MREAAIYPAVAEASPGRVHLKTSGTSYLEALRTVAGHDPDLFRRVYSFALERFGADRASYQLTVDLERVPRRPGGPVLDDPDVRRILHVTFGSVLSGPLGDELRARVEQLHDAYAVRLEAHLARHLRPFAPWR